MKDTREIQLNHTINIEYLPIISMISVSFLIIAMIFTYRIIELGPFLTPGGVIPFAITYIIAGIITEAYGYKNARKIIYGNFICNFVFNITVNFLLKFPVPIGAQNTQSFIVIFDHALFVMCIYSIGFLFGDLANVFFVSKWRGLLKGKYFSFGSLAHLLLGKFHFH